MTDTDQLPTEPKTAGSPAVTGSPFWVRHVTEADDDHTCVRCRCFVMVDFETEWLGPADNYHFNLCNDCAQALVVELWGRLQANADVMARGDNATPTTQKPQ